MATLASPQQWNIDHYGLNTCDQDFRLWVAAWPEAPQLLEVTKKPKAEGHSSWRNETLASDNSGLMALRVL